MTIPTGTPNSAPASTGEPALVGAVSTEPHSAEQAIAQSAAPVVPGPPKRSGKRGRVLRAYFSQPLPALAAFYIALLLIVALVVQLFHPLDPTAQDLSNPLQGPSADHIFGTDKLGRDSFARMVHATRISILAVLEGVAIVSILGVIPGLIAGYFRGKFDAVMVRIADGFLVLPALIVATAVIAILGPGLTNAMFGIGLVLWPGLFRVVRAAVLPVREEAYVTGARTMGASHTQIILRHVVPNIMNPLMVTLALFASHMLLAEASLSFLGLGVQAPQASWGSLISDGKNYLQIQPWLSVFPGIAITLAALSFNLISDGMSRALTRRGLEVRD